MQRVHHRTVPAVEAPEGPHPTLLAVNWTDDLPASTPSLPVHRISDPAVAEAYDVKDPTLFLVRPDNYVGCVTSDPADVAAYRKLIGADR
jgi:hypothetical protein